MRATQRSASEERMDRSAQRWLNQRPFDCCLCGGSVPFGESVTLVDGAGLWAGEAHEACWRGQIGG